MKMVLQVERPKGLSFVSPHHMHCNLPQAKENLVAQYIGSMKPLIACVHKCVRHIGSISGPTGLILAEPLIIYVYSEMQSI